MMSESVYSRRIKRIRRYLQARRCGAFLVSARPNVRYLSGFSGAECMLFLSTRQNFFLGDFRYYLQAEKELCGLFEIKKSSLPPHALAAELVKALNIRTLCFEANHLTVAGYRRFKNTFKKRVLLVPAANVVETMREIKSGEEIRLIKTAQSIAKRSLRILKPMFKAGVTELYLKYKLEQILKNNGAEGPSFDIIVASGPNAAMPHARATDKIVGRGEPVIIDLGAQYQGYKSDLTRTWFLGKMPLYTQYYELVAAAQDRAISRILPAAKIKTIDSAARELIAHAGFGENFGHALGHGVGLEIHEAPQISPKNIHYLKTGMVVTIEPGIYFPGWGGIRIEDVVAVTEKGHEIL